MKFYFVAGANDSVNVLLDEKVRSILVSFAHFKKKLPDRLVAAAKKGTIHLMLDSGAFTNATKPGHVTLPEYIDFVKSHKSLLTEYVTLDDLKARSTTVKNLAKIREAGLDPMLVDHMWFPWFEKFLGPEYKKGKKVCWGGLVSLAQKPSTTDAAAANMNLNVLGKRMKERGSRARAKPVSSVHLLGVGQRIKAFLGFFDVVDSVDSTTWRIAAQKFGRVAWVSRDDQGWPKLHTPHHTEIPDKLKAKLKQQGFDISSPKDCDRIAIRAFKLFFKMVEERYQKAKQAGEEIAQVAKSELLIKDSEAVPSGDIIEVLTSELPEDEMIALVGDLSQDLNPEDINPPLLKEVSDAELLHLHRQLHGLGGSHA